MQHSNSHGQLNTISRKQLIQIGTKKQQKTSNPTGFQLTFNKKDGVEGKQRNKSKNSDRALDKPLQIASSKQVRPSTAGAIYKNENRIKITDPSRDTDKQQFLNKSRAGSQNEAKSCEQEKQQKPRSSNSTPNKKMASFPSRNQSTSNKKRNRPQTNSSDRKKSLNNNHSADDRPRQQRLLQNSASPSRKTDDPHSIDRLIQQNIKLKAQQNKDKINKLKQQREYQELRKRQLQIDNKIIRDRNFNKLMLSKIGNLKEKVYPEQKPICPVNRQSHHDISIIHLDEYGKQQSKYKNVEFKQNRNLKNPDGPRSTIKQEFGEPKEKKKYDLGLEIFDLQKELGLGRYSNKGDLSQRHQIMHNNRLSHNISTLDNNHTERQSRKCQNNIQNNRNDTSSAEKRSRGRSKSTQDQQRVNSNEKKNIQQRDLQKLIQKQKNKWAKRQNQQKANELQQQEKILNNLHTLNQNIDRLFRAQAATPLIRKTDKQIFKIREKKNVSRQEEQFERNNDQSLVSMIEKKKIVNINVKPFQRESIDQNSKNDEIRKAVKLTKVTERPKTALTGNQNRVVFQYMPGKENKQQSQNQNKKDVALTGEQPQQVQTRKSKKKEEKGKKKNPIKKNSLISKLMKQIEIQQYEIQQLKQNQSQIQQKLEEKIKPSSSQGGTSKVTKKEIKSDTSSILNIQKDQNHHNNGKAGERQVQQNQNIIAYPQKEQQPDLNPVVIQEDGDNLIIEDQITINLVREFAAQLIQQKFRQYIHLKKERLRAAMMDSIDDGAFQNLPEEEFKESLSQSIQFEDRFLPFDIRDQISGSQRAEDKQNKKLKKSNFSFGQGANQPIQKIISGSEAIEIVDSSEQVNESQVQLNENVSIILDTSYLPQKSNEKDDSLEQKEEEKEQLNPAIIPQQQDQQDQDLSIIVEKVLKINDKFKYSLRSIAEKQKQTSIISSMQLQKQLQLQKEKEEEKQKRSNQINRKIEKLYQHYINDNPPKSSTDGSNSVKIEPNRQRSIPQEEVDMEAIDISKVSIDYNNNEFVNPSSIDHSIDPIILVRQELNNELPDYSFNEKEEEIKIEEIILETNTFSNDNKGEDILTNGKPTQLEDIQTKKTFPENIGTGEVLSLEESNENEKRQSQLPPLIFDYLSANNKEKLRLVYGDEKYLRENDYDFGADQSHHGGSPHSQQLHSNRNQFNSTTSGNYLMATNASIFDRNPFQEFTTNKLHEILQGKNLNEILSMREEALRYHERLERGYLQRLEKRQEASPLSIQRKRFELEKWVSQRKAKSIDKQNIPENIFDLDEERKEAAEIITRVNRKANELKEKLMQSSGVKSSAHSSLQSKIEEGKSSSKIFNEAQLDLQPPIQNDESLLIVTLNVDDECLQTKTQPEVLILEISSEKEEEEESKIEQARAENQEDQDQLKAGEDLTKVIFEQLIKDEIQKIDFIRSEQLEVQSPSHQHLDKSQQKVEEDALSSLDSIHSSPNVLLSVPQDVDLQIIIENPLEQTDKVQDSEEIKEDLKRSKQDQQDEKEDGLKQVEEEIKKEIQELATQQQHFFPVNVGIDTSDNAIEQYIEEIFEQIRPRKEQFLQAFMTPFFKNPLDVLSQLQRPDLILDDQAGTLSLLDATNSIAYILNVQLYLTLEKAKENLIHETIEQIRQQLLQHTGSLAGLDDDMADLMSEAQHIHNKVIFDCVNEGLNMVRPYGSAGEPMPWSKKPRKNLIFMLDSVDDLDQILHQVKSFVLGWAKTRAGALPSQQVSKQTKAEEDPVVINQRERCLVKLLAQDLVKEEEKWLDYEMEEAQVKIDLSDIVLEHLVGEAVELLQKLSKQQ